MVTVGDCPFSVHWLFNSVYPVEQVSHLLILLILHVEQLEITVEQLLQVLLVVFSI